MSDGGGIRRMGSPSPGAISSAETFHVLFSSSQSGVSSRPSRGVHPGLHPGLEESGPEGHRLPPADIRPTGIPTGILSLPQPSAASLYFDLVSVSLLHTRPFSPSIYSPPLFLTSFQFALRRAASFVLFPPSSSALPFHSPSLLFMRLR